MSLHSVAHRWAFRVFSLVLFATPCVFGQRVEVAKLRPGLVWQRTAPPQGAVEGPVLYQLLFSTAGTPNTIAKFDTNPRHLTNSMIVDTGANLQIGGATGLLIDTTGKITQFAPGQTFPGGLSSVQITGVSGIIATPSPITTTGNLRLDTAFTDARYLQLTGGVVTGSVGFGATPSSQALIDINGTQTESSFNEVLLRSMAP